MNLEELRAKKAFICDMDGVLYHGNRLLDGVPEFIDWILANDKEYLFLTNSSERSPRELQEKMARLGLQVGVEHFYTSALATAMFLARQCPGGSVYAIGEAGLINALYDAGFSMNDVDPDYVVVGETRAYGFEHIEKAVRLVANGAKLIGTNPDITAPSEAGIIPATRCLVAPIEMASGRNAYYVGKPNPLMMRQALKRLGIAHADCVIIGDRMDTDILAGLESDIDTVLVLSGVSSETTPRRFPYRPHIVLPNVGAIPNGI